MKPLVIFRVSTSNFCLAWKTQRDEMAPSSYPGPGIMSNIPTFKFAFVFFMVTSSWTLLSILTAVESWEKQFWTGGDFGGEDMVTLVMILLREPLLFTHCTL